MTHLRSLNLPHLTHQECQTLSLRQLQQDHHQGDSQPHLGLCLPFLNSWVATEFFHSHQDQARTIGKTRTSLLRPTRSSRHQMLPLTLREGQLPHLSPRYLGHQQLRRHLSPVLLPHSRGPLQGGHHHKGQPDDLRELLLAGLTPLLMSQHSTQPLAAGFLLHPTPTRQLQIQRGVLTTTTIPTRPESLGQLLLEPASRWTLTERFEMSL